MYQRPANHAQRHGQVQGPEQIWYLHPQSSHCTLPQLDFANFLYLSQVTVELAVSCDPEYTSSVS